MEIGAKRARGSEVEVTKPKNSPHLSLMLTIALAVLTWVFSAGKLWQRVDDLEKDISELQKKVDKVIEQHDLLINQEKRAAK